MRRPACDSAPFLALLLTLIAAFPGGARAQNPVPTLTDTFAEGRFLPQTPSVTGGAVSAFANPAALASSDVAGFAFWWSDRSVRRDALDDYGFSIGRTLGFAMNSRVFPVTGGSRRVTDYQLGLGVGDRRRMAGLAYRWSHGSTADLIRPDALVLGAIERPSRHLSLGGSLVQSIGEGGRVWQVDAGLRPLRREWLTLFADYAYRDHDLESDGRVGFGLEIRPVHGLHLGVKAHQDERADDDLRLSLDLGVTLAEFGVHALPGFDSEGDLDHTTWLLQGAPPYRDLPLPSGPLFRKSRPVYVPVNLENRRLTYQKYRWGDDERVAWLDLAAYLDAVRDDPTVTGVAFNLAGFSTSVALAWELRQKLTELRAAGKEVLIHLDRPGFTLYYLASAADRITLDPQGEILLPGIAVRRTYLKGTLDKLGLGFQELRFFTHKTAEQRYSRRDMSEADREQLGRMADVIYETVRDGVCESRRLTPDRFDAAVNDKVILSPAEARELGLVDDIARWPEQEKWLRAERAGARFGRPAQQDLKRRYYDEPWGEPARIAVVYAVGECAMDSGIRGRATSAYLRAVAKDPRVKAVVLRADSPGGDPLPSDLVTEAVRMIKEAGKPVIVSQGSVAASGGYWISMDGTRILTTPVTVTGSIGVIAGWLWDEGFGEKTGLSADGVQRGEHADLFTGIRLPLLEATLPQRPLDEEELARVEVFIRASYDDFVTRVAAGRGLDEARVRELAEGRVWMGPDAVANGLCDGFGSLPDAIRLARETAGIAPAAEVELVEFPPRRLFEWPSFGPELPALASILSPVGAAAVRLRRAVAGEQTRGDIAEGDDADYAFRYLRLVAASPGRPVLAVSPDLLPSGWGEP